MYYRPGAPLGASAAESLDAEIKGLLKGVSPDALKNKLVADSKQFAAQNINAFVNDSSLPPEVKGMATAVVGSLIAGDPIDADALAKSAVALGAAAACSAVPGGVIAAPICSMVAVAVYPTVRDGILRLAGRMTSSDREKIAAQRRVNTIQAAMRANTWALIAVRGKLVSAVKGLAEEWLRIRLAKLVVIGDAAMLDYDTIDSVQSNPFRTKQTPSTPAATRTKQLAAINLFLKTMKPLFPFLRAELRPEHYTFDGKLYYDEVYLWFEQLPQPGGIPYPGTATLFKPTPASLKPLAPSVPLWATMLMRMNASKGGVFAADMPVVTTNGYIKDAAASIDKKTLYNAHMFNELPFSCTKGSYGTKQVTQAVVPSGGDVFAKAAAMVTSAKVVTKPLHEGLRCSLREGHYLDFNAPNECGDGFIIASDGKVYPTLMNPASTEASCQDAYKKQLAVISKVMQHWAEVSAQTPPLLAQVTETRTREVYAAREKALIARATSAEGRLKTAEEKLVAATKTSLVVPALVALTGGGLLYYMFSRKRR